VNNIYALVTFCYLCRDLWNKKEFGDIIIIAVNFDVADTEPWNII